MSINERRSVESYVTAWQELRISVARLIMEAIVEHGEESVQAEMIRQGLMERVN